MESPLCLSDGESCALPRCMGSTGSVLETGSSATKTLDMALGKLEDNGHDLALTLCFCLSLQAVAQVVVQTN